MRTVTLAATQFACSWNLQANLDAAERVIRRAAGQGAQVVCVQELFATPYFCITQDPTHFAHALPFEGNPIVARFAALVKELGVHCQSRFSSNAPGRRISIRWRWRMRTGVSSAFTGKAISRRGRDTRRSSISRPATPGSGSRTRPMAGSASGLPETAPRNARGRWR